MENNNEVERARAWFGDMVAQNKWRSICIRNGVDAHKLPTIEKLIELYREHPQQPQRDAEQTYSIEDRFAELIRSIDNQDVLLGVKLAKTLIENVTENITQHQIDEIAAEKAKEEYPELIDTMPDSYGGYHKVDMNKMERNAYSYGFADAMEIKLSQIKYSKNKQPPY